VFREKVNFCERRADSFRQRVADVRDWDVVLPEKSLFEREDAEEFSQIAAHAADAALAPGPDLRSDKINDRDAAQGELAGDTEVEIGRIGQDGELWAIAIHGSDQLPVFAIDPRNVGEDFDQTDHRQALRFNDSFDAGGTQAGAGAADETSAGPALLEFGDEESGVQVAGGLAGGNENNARGFVYHLLEPLRHLMPVESAHAVPAKAKIEDFATSFRDQLISLNSQFSYFCSPAMVEDDLRQYLHEPISALPPAVCKLLPKSVALMLVPYLEKLNGKGGMRISFGGVAEAKQSPAYRLAGPGGDILFFAVKNEEVSDYHYGLFNEIARLVSNSWTRDIRDGFAKILKSELAAKINGEVDERSWRMKQALHRKAAANQGKAFAEYARQAFEDTLTLYLHGICCDIDVEPGPRQLPSRYVRKRLEYLHELFPPPAGHAVFPEELKNI
jgi:hypothetical protein